MNALRKAKKKRRRDLERERVAEDAMLRWVFRLNAALKARAEKRPPLTWYVQYTKESA